MEQEAAGPLRSRPRWRCALRCTLTVASPHSTRMFGTTGPFASPQERPKTLSIALRFWVFGRGGGGGGTTLAKKSNEAQGWARGQCKAVGGSNLTKPPAPLHPTASQSSNKSLRNLRFLSGPVRRGTHPPAIPYPTRCRGASALQGHHMVPSACRGMPRATHIAEAPSEDLGAGLGTTSLPVRFSTSVVPNGF